MLTPHPDRKLTLHTQQSTMYAQGGYGMSKVEVREILIETGPYAQYAAAVFVTYIPRGARKPKAFVQTYRPDLVVLAGWDHFSPDDPMLPAQEIGNGVSVSAGRYRSCDPRWASDFGGTLGRYLDAKSLSALADMRQHNTQGR